MCHTEKGQGILSWEREGKVPHHNLAKSELSPSALGLCPSWEAVSGLGQGPCSFFFGDQVVAAQACWVEDSGSAYLFRLPVERMRLLLNHGTCLSSSRPQEAGPRLTQCPSRREEAGPRLTQCLQQPCRHSILGHLMPILPF